MEGCPGFDFAGDHAAAGGQQDVDLGAARFTIVVQRRLASTVGVVLVDFASHPAFKNCATPADGTVCF